MFEVVDYLIFLWMICQSFSHGCANSMDKLGAFPGEAVASVGVSWWVTNKCLLICLSSSWLWQWWSIGTYKAWHAVCAESSFTQHLHFVWEFAEQVAKQVHSWSWFIFYRKQGWNWVGMLSSSLTEVMDWFKKGGGWEKWGKCLFFFWWCDSPIE